MAGDADKYATRINEYMLKLGISDQTRRQLSERLVQYKSINGERVKDIFICNERATSPEGEPASIWFFTNNVASELRGLGPDIRISMMNHNSVLLAKMDASHFDLLVARKDSAIDLTVFYSFGQQYVLSARGYNCSSLLIIFRKYFSKTLAPGDIPGPKATD
jgi:hypothetical protein